MQFYQALAIIFALSLFAALFYIYRMNAKLEAIEHQKSANFGGNIGLELQDMKDSIHGLEQELSKRRTSLKNAKRQ